MSSHPPPRPGPAEFADFAQAQTPGLLGFAHALTGNPHDAWDLTQETLVRMGERWGRTRFDEPAAYARTVMTRLNIDRLRRFRREVLTPAPGARTRGSSWSESSTSGSSRPWRP